MCKSWFVAGPFPEECSIQGFNLRKAPVRIVILAAELHLGRRAWYLPSTTPCKRPCPWGPNEPKSWDHTPFTATIWDVAPSNYQQSLMRVLERGTIIPVRTVSIKGNIPNYTAHESHCYYNTSWNEVTRRSVSRMFCLGNSVPASTKTLNPKPHFLQKLFEQQHDEFPEATQIKPSP